MKRFLKYCLIIFVIGLFHSISVAQTVTSEDKGFDLDTYFFEALKHRAIENYTKAIENLEKCVQIDKENPAVFFEFSKNYFQLKKDFEAEVFINKALLIKPLDKDLMQFKVEILKRKQDYKLAIEIQQKIVKNYPEQTDGLVELFILTDNLNEATNLIKKIEDEGSLTTKTIQLKYALELKKQPKEVKINKEKLLDLDVESLKKRFTETKDYLVLKELLEMELKQNLVESLFEDSKNALDLFPSQTFVYRMNAIALYKLGKYLESNVVLTNGIDFVIDGEEEALFYDLFAQNYQQLNKSIEVLKYKQKAAELRKKQ